MPKDKQKKADRKKKAGKKTAQLAIRIEKSERDAFVALCEAQDTSAAREIRRFMRDYVAAHGGTSADGAEPPEPEAAAEAPAETAEKPARRPSRAPRAKPAVDAPDAPKARRTRAAKADAPAAPAAEATTPKRRAPRKATVTA